MQSAVPPTNLHTVALPAAGVSAKQLLEMASSNLRCIDGDNLTLDLLRSNKGGSIDLSRPVASGERIDFFMSHSWHDDPMKKISQLTELCGRFYMKHNRVPTFWLDKVMNRLTMLMCNTPRLLMT